MLLARSGLRSSSLATRLEYLLALGQALFLEDEFGAAASLFASAVVPARALDPALRESFVDWWGSAVERQADVAGAEFRAGPVQRPRACACEPSWAAAPNPQPPSTGRPPRSGAPGDSSAAWDAAIAGWVRARLAGERSASLRADLDKLVLQGIIPDRVRLLPPLERAGLRIAAARRLGTDQRALALARSMPHRSS